MPTTPRQGFRYPVAGDPAELWTYWQNLATDVDNEPGDRGTGSTFPTTNLLVGDTYWHTTYGCAMRWNGTSWRQIETASVANNTEKTAWFTAVRNAGLQPHNGFLLFQQDTDQMYVCMTPAGAVFRPLNPEDWSNSSVNPGNTASGTGWLGTTFGWDVPLGAKVTIPADGIRRVIKMTAACNMAGDGYLRIRVEGGGTNSYWPNTNGIRSIPGASQEQTMAIVGRYISDGSTAVVIYLEARSQSASSATFFVPVLDITAF